MSARVRYNLADRKWIERDGVSHVVRATEGKHHSCLCGAYCVGVAGSVPIEEACPKCLDFTSPTGLKHAEPSTQLPHAVVRCKGMPTLSGRKTTRE